MRNRINDITNAIIETIDIWYCNGKLDIKLQEQLDDDTLLRLIEVVSYLIEDYRPDLDLMWLNGLKRGELDQQCSDKIILTKHTQLAHSIAQMAHEKLISERWVEPKLN